MVYEFIVMDQANAKAFIVNGVTPDKKNKICVAMFYYDYGIPREVIEGVAGAFAAQLNTDPLEVIQQ